MYMIEGDVESLFPDLDTWGARQERHIPTVDRDGSLLRHVRERRIIPHPGLESILLSCDETGSETAGDAAIGPRPRPVQVKFFGESASHTFDVVLLCTGYTSSLEASENRHTFSSHAVLGRAHFVGLGPEPKDLLPLAGIGREAQSVAQQICQLLQLKRRRVAQRAEKGRKSPDTTKVKES